MKKNCAVVISLIAIALLVFPYISIAMGGQPDVAKLDKRKIEKMTTSNQSNVLTAQSTSQLPMKGIGCWVQKPTLKNSFIYSDVCSWYVADFSIMDSFDNKLNRPLFMSYAKKSDPDFLIEKMKQYKSKIVGVIWDYEVRDTPQSVAERDLKKAYTQAKDLNLSFGVFLWANPKNSLKVNGVSYENARTFADFLMPMLYVQLYDMRREKLEELISKERALTRLPLIATLTLETTRKSLKKAISPQEIVSIYKNLPVDGFCVWNLRNLDEEYVKALSAISK
jgi:hypothetical protein